LFAWLKKNTALALIALAIALGFAWHVSREPMDFRVYYHGAQGVFDGTRPVYGHQSGMGWPMHYRYPPLFLFLVRPLTFLPLPWAAAVFTLLKAGALFLLICALWNRLGPTRSKAAWLIPVLFAGPYVVEDLRYGNVQSLIFVLTGAALLALTGAPLLAAALLALAISIKVWPLFFLPVLLFKREWKVVGWTLAFTMVLMLLPALYFGIGGNLYVLKQWALQEFSTQTGQAEIWFPSQSLRGVLMRYFTVIDYSLVPDSNYPRVHIATMAPIFIRAVWLGLVASLYAGLLAITASRKTVLFGVIEALAFTALILLEPFSQKYTLVVLLWPAIVAGRLAVKSRARGILWAAIILSCVQPLMYGRNAQRLLQVLGLDFLLTVLLAAFLVISIFETPTEQWNSG
jgi:Glycosyltransferase family 87